MIKRRTSLVDQDAVGLVDDREVVGALNRHLRFAGAALTEIDLLESLAMSVPAELEPLELVAEEIEAQLLGSPVRDITCVGGSPDRVGLPGLNAAHRQPERAVNRPHPFGVAAGQVVVHSHDVHTLTRQRVQERGHRGNERFPFAGFQLGDAAMVDRDAADDLHIELPLSDRSLRGLTDKGVRFRQQAVQRITLPRPQDQIVRLDS